MNTKRIIKKATKFGIPSDMLYRSLRFGRIARNPVDFVKRRNAARELMATSPHADMIDRRKGYATFGMGDFPGLAEAVDAARRVYEEKINHVDPEVHKKPYLINLLKPEDHARFPEITGFAASAPMRDASACYLGTMPELRGVSVFVSMANDSMEKSQYYHTDSVDMTQIKCFINVNDIGPDNGPFTFLPADVSDRVAARLGHRFPSPHVEDEELFTICNESEAVSLVGGPGTGGLVDTSRCLHFGSRCNTGYRLVIMFQYTRQPNLFVAGQIVH